MEYFCNGKLICFDYYFLCWQQLLQASLRTNHKTPSPSQCNKCKARLCAETGGAVQTRKSLRDVIKKNDVLEYIYQRKIWICGDASVGVNGKSTSLTRFGFLQVTKMAFLLYVTVNPRSQLRIGALNIFAALFIWLASRSSSLGHIVVDHGIPRRIQHALHSEHNLSPDKFDEC